MLIFYSVLLLFRGVTTKIQSVSISGGHCSPKVFSQFLSPMEFWFLAIVAFGLLSWGCLISGNTANLIAQILFKEN